MSNGWREVSLGEISRDVSYGYTESANEIKVGPRFLRITDIQGGIVNWKNVPYCPISEKDFKKYKLNRNDILVARTGNSTGENYFFDSDEEAVFASYLIKFVLHNEDICPKFVWYNMRTYRWWKFIENNKTGSAQAGANAKVLSNFKLHLPPLPEQKAIAHILGTLDDKIELNRKMNETLEVMAQALFKSWFVDFDPVIDNALAVGNEIPEQLKAKAERRKAVVEKGQYKILPKEIQALFSAAFVFNEELGKWIPEGWEVLKLESQVEVKYGKDHKKLHEGEYPCYGSGGIMRYVEKPLCESESVLIPRKGTLNNMMYVRDPFWSVDTMFFTLFKKQNMVKFLFYFLKKFNFAEMNVGSAVPSMTTKVLNNIDLIIPNESILEYFEKQVELIVKRKEANTKQNENIAKTRDILLSQLISGKTRLPASFIQQFESQTEAVPK